MQLYPHNYAEIVAAVVCTVCLLYKPSVTNRWFVGFLWLTVAIEFSGKLLAQNNVTKIFVYNVFNIVEFSFYLSFLSVIRNSKKNTRVLKTLIIIIVAVGVLNLLFGQQQKKYNNYTTMLGSVMVLFACLLLYFTLLNSKTFEGVSLSFLLITFGLLLFYAGNFFVYAFYDSLRVSNPGFLVSVYRIVNGYLNVLMYSCFALSFIIELSFKPL